MKGVTTGDLGVAKDGHHKDGFTPGMNLLGKYTLFAEGARGSLTKQLLQNIQTATTDCDSQKFGIGLKELWELPPDKHKRGLVMHTMGWPLDNSHRRRPLHVSLGREFLLHRLCRPSELFEPLHLAVRRIPARQASSRRSAKCSKAASASAMARARSPKAASSRCPSWSFPGGALIGCAAGFVNVPRIKGSHNAMKTGMLAAEAVARGAGCGPLRRCRRRPMRQPIAHSHVYKDLKRVRNVKPLWSRFGTIVGVPLAALDMWTNQLFGFSFFGTLKHGKPDYATLKPASQSQEDRLSQAGRRDQLRQAFQRVPLEHQP